ncbi:S1-C subfamily serine protease [Nocardioides aromaticivorans]|uniref:S1-C subfamily serine protease n=1 Tax=Nocardioides aromaticivorans TaxID=200618 RepID=A0A7Z0CQ54_9ACTN|nr:trypsin-like peptidase domain-containing protein [Nocardioides aromaticivorans]NYI46620.1 S1-C subfamily serine protease [Nocardioides aromaticivorans]
MTSPTPPPPYLPPPPPPPFGPAGHARRRSGRGLVAAGVAGGVLLVGTGAATTAVALQVLDRDGAASAGTSLVPSTTAQDGTGSRPDTGTLPELTPYGGGQDAGSETASDASAEQSTGIVQITSTLTNGTGAGTGLVLDADGTIVTNHHVVDGATRIEVTVVSTGQTYRATYLGGDAVTDVAVLQLEGASGLTPVDLSDDAAQVGDQITAVGDAGGDGGSLTAAPGTVSALGQDITVQETDGSSTKLTDLIRMDAYVVPGDSGGAVLDDQGDVVGMNVAASSGSRNVTGYAIPIATVESVVDRIEAGDESGDIELGYSGYLGVGLDPSASSALIAQVIDDTAAEEAGLAVGDTITAVDGDTIGTADALRSAIAAHDPGDRVTITWTTSGGSTRSATVTLGEGPVS